ncbi:MAG: phosphatase PAP2 family protein [Pirellulaceae bacterium]|nr:phosphatase PAP2 family protein [Pirellulaceae bacterium]
MQTSPLKALRPALVPTSAGGPARLFAAAAMLAMLAAAALLVDLPLARWIDAANASRGIPGDLARFIRLGEAFGYGGSVLLIVLAAAVLDPRGWRVAPRLALAAFGAGLLADSIKLLIARWRPEHAPLDGAVGQTFAGWLPIWHGDALAGAAGKYGHKLQSFPSGHAATAMGLAVGLAALYPRGRWLFVALAALAATQRLHGEAHFLSDVLAGAALGCLVGAVLGGGNPLGNWLAKLESGPNPRSENRPLAA